MKNGYSKILDSFSAEGRLRKIPGNMISSDVIDLTLNDYMGLAKRSHEFREEFFDRFGDVGMTSSASRLLASDQNVYAELENYLSEVYGASALLFNSGYHANAGVTGALNIPNTLWATDKLIHASVIDGLRMAHAEALRWNHNDLNHLRKIIERNHDKYERIIVVIESIYSMDGDTAPLREIVELKREFKNLMIYLDEAHALGTIGPSGLGIAAKEALLDDIDILIGTLGKACASAGAFVITSAKMKQYLINTSRSLIFSTAIAPVNAAWSLLMLEKLAKMESERYHLASISEKFRKGIESITGIPNCSESAIVPLLTGNSENAATLSKWLAKRKIHALPIRRPTVPAGGERIRFSLNASLTGEDIDKVLTAISEFRI